MKTLLVARLLVILCYELVAMAGRFLLMALSLAVQGLVRVLFQLNIHLNF